MTTLSHFDSAAIVLAALAMACFGYVISDARKKRPLPPAPAKPRPITGHVHLLPTRNEHVVYRNWAKQLKSDVIALKVPGQTLIILNSARAAYDVFSKRARKYSGRPHIPMVTDHSLVDWSGHTAFLPHGERWKQQRQLMHSSFSKNGDHGATGFRLYYRIYPYVWGADLILVEGAAAHLGEALLPTNFLVNIFPWLRYVPAWFPGAGWKKVASEWRKELRDTIEIPYRFTVKQVADGTAPPSALSEILADAQTHPEGLTQELMDRIMWTAGTLYTAAMDSLVSTLQVFMLAMVLHREVQVKIQKEIDQITGGKRMPEPSDAEHMPYMRCVILEILRWQTVTPLGIPHLCEEEDVYEGYRIPKNSLVFGNIWAINRDDSVYDEPNSFIPERFMDLSIPEPANFGFGRRVCPGVHFAHASLFINIATMLAIFDINPTRDEAGNQILPIPEMIAGTLAHAPVPFKCLITPRSDLHRQMLMEGSA